MNPENGFHFLSLQYKKTFNMVQLMEDGSDKDQINKIRYTVC